jgi:AAA domain, putative AbiEii toxin, Type IV TA system/AAA ATPase domain
MTPRWKIEVEGLGKIEHADVEMRPLTLFVGENNSGKSYLASLLWGLIATQMELSPPNGEVLEKCEERISAHIAEGKAHAAWDLTSEEVQLFERLFSAALEENRTKLVKRVFKSDSLSAKSISFRNLACSEKMRFEWTLSGASRTNNLLVCDEIAGKDSRIQTAFRSADLAEVRQVSRSMLMRRVVFGRLNRLFVDFDETYASVDPIYLPASRTGFMQLYKAFVRGVVRGGLGRGGESDPANMPDLTAPVLHFVDLLAFGLSSKREGKYATEANFLESALQGHINLAAGAVGVNDYQYLPEGAKTSIPMALSSSLVTEIAPIILVLRHLSGFPVLILEEPEAHLHPKLQRRLAQVVVRLVRKGLYVWITTHSENFCQQINNFIKFGALASDRRSEVQAKLGYEPQDYLELDDVAGYQFELDETGERSTVTELKKLEQGLVMPTFNKELLRLGEEMDFLDRAVAS